MIRFLLRKHRLTHPRGRVATWALLCVYLATGPVMEALHSEPESLSVGSSACAALHGPGEPGRSVPVDQSHVCVICTLLTERLTTPAVPYQLSPLRTVSPLTVSAINERPVPVRYSTPDKRGPPSAHI